MISLLILFHNIHNLLLDLLLKSTTDRFNIALHMRIQHNQKEFQKFMNHYSMELKFFLIASIYDAHIDHIITLRKGPLAVWSVFHPL
jgi:hypothetical protein